MRAKDDAVNDACRIWNETADAKKALQPLKGNRSHSIEESVLKTLSQQGNTSYVNALQKVSEVIYQYSRECLYIEPYLCVPAS